MSKIRRSASVVLAEGWESDRVYLALRHLEHRAFPGTYVFPGGKVDPADADVPVRDADPAVPREEYVAAARELLEETGVLVAVPRSGGRIDPARLDAPRRSLLDRTGDFRAILAELDAEIDGSLLVPLGVKTTPPFHPVRFRNRFFMAVLPAGQEPTVIPGELERGDWFRAADAVDRFESTEIRLAPPILLLLEAWGARGARAALPDLRGFDDATFADRPIRIRFSPEIVLFPGRTPTLPPATHTNTYVLGKDRLLVVDPATPDPKDQAKLALLLEEMTGEGARVEAVVLTHHHPDHIQATRLVQEAHGVPLWAHAETAALLPEEYVVDRALEDGDVLDLGEGGEVEVLHTPGHAPGHVCLFQRKFDGLIAGDMISTASTIVIDPPEGDLRLYMESLARLRALGARQLYPAHGDPVPHVRRTLDYFLAHRLGRLEKVAASLAPAARDLDALVPLAYDDVKPEVFPIAKRSLLASLLFLEEDGRARREGDAWARAG